MDSSRHLPGDREILGLRGKEPNMEEGLSQTVSAGGLGRREQGNQEAGGSAGLEAGGGTVAPSLLPGALCDEEATAV